VSTRSDDRAPALAGPDRPVLRRPDPAELVARVALARRDLLLRVHRHRLGREDLEDCYSQATLELVQRARSGGGFDGPAHVAHAAEQKFLSRIHDRRRALEGRSPMEAALGQAAPLETPDGGGEFADPGMGVEDQVAMRAELAMLREIAAELTEDMRLVLAHQVGLGTECQAFCQQYGWSAEKFRKVAQRARRRLLALSDEQATGERCRRLETDLLAYVSHVADTEQRARVTTHFRNCPACRRRARELRAQERGLLALLPGGLEAGVTGGAIGSAAGGGAAAAGGGAAVGGGIAAWAPSGVVGIKIGVFAVCLAGLAGGGVALCRGGSLTRFWDHRAHHQRVVAHAAPTRRQHPVVLARPADLGLIAAPARVPAVAPPSVALPSPDATSPRSAAALARREFGFGALTNAAPVPLQVSARTARHRHRRRRRREAHAAVSLAPAQSPPVGPSPSVTRPSTPTHAPSESGTAANSSGEFGFESG